MQIAIFKQGINLKKRKKGGESEKRGGVLIKKQFFPCSFVSAGFKIAKKINIRTD